MASTFIIGTEGADLLNGAAGNDTIRGLGGNDTINGSEGNDDLDGGDGNDLIIGGAGNDIIQGGKGADTILGGAGDDVIRGGKGSDSIDGGDGNDTIYSGYGNDTLTGGAGSDVFVLKGKQDAANPAALVAPTITDFVAGTDTIAIEGVTAAEITAALAGQTTVTGGVSFKIGDGTIVVKGTGLTALTSSNVVTEASIPSAPAAGQTFTLTTGVDVINGTSGNDTIIADNTGATATLSVADQINGGSGTDTLKIYLAAAGTTTGQPTLTSIENVYINGGVVTAYTAATGTTGLEIDAPVLTGGALAAATYTVNGQSVTLKGANVTANSTTTIAGNTPTALALTLNGWTKTGAVTNTVDLSGTKVATLNLSTATAASNVVLTNTGAALKTINISGDQAVTLAPNAATTLAVTTVDASTATGAVTYSTVAGPIAAGFKFTGGSANDTLLLADNALTTLTAGTQLVGGAGTGDKLGLLDTALTAGETAKINATTGFEVLGLNANITLDASTLTSIKSFSIDTTALTQSITNMATGSTTTITAAAPTSLTLATAVGVTDTSIALAGAGVAVGTLVVTGITSIALASGGTAANSIGTLTNSDNSVINVTGAQDLTLALSAGTAIGSKIDASAFTGKGTFTGSNITTSGDIIIGGAGADTINGRSGADTLTGNGGADTFVFTATAAANASGAVFGQADVITDFVVGTDKIQFAGVVDVVSAQQAAVQTAVTALAAGSTDAQIATAMATASTTNLGVSVATFGGNTYVLYETTGASTGVAADDVFIKLTGVASGFTFANDVIA